MTNKCRNCKYWSPDERNQARVKNYPENIEPGIEFIVGNCSQIFRGIQVTSDDCVYIDTDANFSCGFFKQK